MATLTVEVNSQHEVTVSWSGLDIATLVNCSDGVQRTPTNVNIYFSGTYAYSLPIAAASGTQYFDQANFTAGQNYTARVAAYVLVPQADPLQSPITGQGPDQATFDFVN